LVVSHKVTIGGVDDEPQFILFEVAGWFQESVNHIIDVLLKVRQKLWGFGWLFVDSSCPSSLNFGFSFVLFSILFVVEFTCFLLKLVFEKSHLVVGVRKFLLKCLGFKVGVKCVG
jgi:hypothetical protein